MIMCSIRTVLAVALSSLCLTPVARAQQTHVLIVTGLSGEPQYQAAFKEASDMLADAARTKWSVPDSSLIILGEDPIADKTHRTEKATREEVEKAFLRLSRRVAPGDLVLVFLNGHGAGEGLTSRVNLSGPDPTASDYATWVSGFAKQTVVFVNAASGSGDFVAVLASKGRVIVTATKTAIEKNESVFARPFVRGLTGTEADSDKDGSVSVFEAFVFAKKEVAREYDADKRMLTEHALVSDTTLARAIGFGGARTSGDPRIRALASERQALEQQVAELRARKATTDSTAYEAALEKLLLAIAEKTQAIRAAGGKP